MNVNMIYFNICIIVEFIHSLICVSYFKCVSKFINFKNLLNKKGKILR